MAQDLQANTASMSRTQPALSALWTTRSFTSRPKQRLRVLVLGDRKDRARANYWPQMLERLRSDIQLEWRCRSVSDDLRGDLKWQSRTTLELLQDAEVLIVNWDSINGDPDFGAHITCDWCAHRRNNILGWVFDGGVLLIEGQANLGIPAQSAYDSILGFSELSTCGAEDPLNPIKQELRVGKSVKLSRQAKNSRLFELLPRVLSVQGGANHDDMFPRGTAGRLVARFLRRGQWPLLYRGWFQPHPFRRTRFHWIPLVKTEGRSFNHPTLMVAQYGTGAIFASTMLLASSNQPGLVEAILETHNHTNLLPQPKRLTTLIARHKIDILIPLTAALAAYLTTLWIPAVVDLIDEPWVQTSFIIGIGALFYLMERLFRFMRILVRDIRGA